LLYAFEVLLVGCQKGELIKSDKKVFIQNVFRHTWAGHQQNDRGRLVHVGDELLPAIKCEHRNADGWILQWENRQSRGV